MDYVLANALEILWLCLGAGFLLVSVVASRAIWIATKTIRKVNAITDLTVEYINKPLSMIVQAEKSFSRFMDRMGR